MIRASLAVLALSTTLLIACTETRASKIAPEQMQVAIVDHSRPLKALKDTPVPDLPAAVQSTFRLGPDRRFVRAAADVLEILTGEHIRQIELDFKDGRWTIAVNGRPAVTFPETPRFEEALTMLTAMASATPASSRAAVPAAVLAGADAQIDEFYAPNLVTAISNIETAVGGKLVDPEGIQRLSRAATRLFAQAYDDFALGDALGARALALMAIASASSPVSPDEKALLAWTYGYQTEARNFAESTENDSVSRAFITGAVPAAQKHRPAFRFIEMTNSLRAFPLSPEDEEVTAATGVLDMRAPQIIIQNGKFGDRVRIGRTAAFAVNQMLVEKPLPAVTLDGRSDWFTAAQLGAGEIDSAGEILATFERNLVSRADGFQSRHIGTDAFRAFYEANFYTALRTEFDHHYRFLASGKACREFVTGLGTPASPAGKEVQQWMSVITAGWYEGGANTRPSTVVDAMPLIGGVRRQEAWAVLSHSLGWYNPQVRKTATTLFRHLDSRPSEVWAALLLTAAHLSDPLRRDHYTSLVIERAPGIISPADWAWIHGMTGNVDELRKLADSPDTAPELHGQALIKLLELDALDQRSLEKQYERIIAATADERTLHRYMDVLARSKRPAAKERAARAWLARYGKNATAIQIANITALMGEGLEGQGKYEEAFALVEPHVPVWSEGIVQAATSLLQRLGRNADALELGQRMVERYDGTDTRVRYAVILWRMRRFDEAASLFDTSKYKLHRGDWHRYGLAFGDWFGGRNQADGLTAFEALISAGIDSELLPDVPRSVASKDPKLALALAERILTLPAFAPVEHGDGNWIAAITAGFEAMKQLEGKKTAGEWVNARIPSGFAYQILHSLYNSRELELLVQIGMAHRHETKPIEIETLIASSLTELRVPKTDPRWSDLRADIAGHSDSEDSLVAVNKYLAGLLDEAAFIASAKTAQDRCTVAYYLGITSAIAGNSARAHDMIVAAAEGPHDFPPQVWAIDTISRWASAKKTWSQIAQQPI